MQAGSIEAEKVKIAQNWITQVKKTLELASYEEKLEKLREIWWAESKTKDIIRSLDLNYSNKESEFNTCVVQQPVFTNNQMFFSFSDSGTLAVSMVTFNSSIYYAIKQFKLIKIIVS